MAEPVGLHVRQQMAELVGHCGLGACMSLGQGAPSILQPHSNPVADMAIVSGDLDC
jgi:hypothetical protein